MGPNDWLSVAAVAVVVLLLAGLSGLFLVTLNRGEANEKKKEEGTSARDRSRGRATGSGSNSRLRNRLRQRRRQQLEDDLDDNEMQPEDRDDEEEFFEEDALAPGGTHNERVTNRRLANREARREDRQAERARLDAKREKQSAYEERRRQREVEREERERQEEEERQKAAEERRKKEEEEAAKWAEFITVEQTGEKQGLEEEGILKRFVDTIRDRKTVVLEDLAAEFRMRTQEVIQRVQDLEKMGRITGVMDDRGKFIYISMEEMEHVANFIKSRGRVAISELARRSNGFIDLESKPVKGQQNIDLDLGDLEEGPEPVDVTA